MSIKQRFSWPTTAFGLHRATSSQRRCFFPIARIQWPPRCWVSATKTEVGGVALGIENAGQLQTALDGLFTIGDRVLVEEMIAPGVAELLVSVRREAPVGIVIMLGTGGTLAEVVDDTATLLAPPATGAVEDALEGLKVGQLLSGFRGAAPGDIDSVIDTVDALVAILETRPDIAEIEINPLIVTPDRAVAADSLISWTAV